MRAAARGYAVVIQDVRGRFSADGEFYTFVNEMDDGYDSVEWVAGQSWCNGKVGMYGASYVGATQWLAASSKPPSLAAIAPGVTASDYHEGWAWQGGAFELGFNLSWSMGPLVAANWQNLSRRLFLPSEQGNRLIEAKDDLSSGFSHLPMQDLPDLKGDLAPYYYDWLAHPEYDEYWRRICIEEFHQEISVPAFSFGGWYDIFLGGTLANFTRMSAMGATERARRGQRLMIGPWVHGGSPTNVSGEYGFGTRSSSQAIDLHNQTMRYYDHWLKEEENGWADEKPVRIFVMGANQWRYEDEWPLSRAQEVNYYLGSSGKANTLNGDGALSTEPPGEQPPDVYVYNPLDPVPTRGGGLCCDPAFLPSGAYDQRAIESRPDVLVYSTPPLERDVEATGSGTGGPIRLQLGPGYRLHGEAGGRGAQRVQPEPGGRHHSRAVPAAAPTRQPHPAGAGVRFHDRPNGDQQPVQAGPQDTPGDIQQQLPQVRPEHEHRGRYRHRRRAHVGAADHLPQPRVPLSRPAPHRPTGVDPFHV